MLSNCFLEKQNTLFTKCLTGIHKIFKKLYGGLQVKFDKS